jgi:hypothetical protein
MAYSRVVIPGDGTTTQITASFALGVISQSDVKVNVTGENDGAGNIIYRDYTLITPTLYDVQGTPAPVGEFYVVERRVSKEELVVDWESQEPITEENLNIMQKQAIMISHEALDNTVSSLVMEDGSEGATIARGTAGTLPMWSAGGQLIEGPTADEVENAQAYAGAASAQATAAALAASAAAASAANAAAALGTKVDKAGDAMTGDLNMTGHAIINIGDGVADFITGLTTVRASTTTITVGTGSIKGNGRFVKNLASMTKSLNVAWAAGGSAGALDTGTFAASSTYFLHALRKISDGSFDWLSSLSPTSPTVPTGYEHVGRIWLVTVNASSQIIDYIQYGNTCRLAAAVQESSITSQIAKTLVTVSAAPNGLSVDMLFDLVVVAAATINSNSDCKLYDGHTPAGSTAYSMHGTSSSATAANSVSTANTGTVRTNATRQIYQIVTYTVSSGNTILSSMGWTDWQLPRRGV